MTSTFILLIVCWLSNGEIISESISTHSIAECNNHAPAIIEDIEKHNKKIKRTRHVCMEMEA